MTVWIVLAFLAFVPVFIVMKGQAVGNANTENLSLYNLYKYLVILSFSATPEAEIRKNINRRKNLVMAILDHFDLELSDLSRFSG